MLGETNDTQSGWSGSDWLGPEPDAEILADNLRALGPANRALAQRLASQAPRTDLKWIDTDEGWSASLAVDGGERALASRRRPRSEAFRLGETVDVHERPCAAVLGFGLGYHVAEIARRMRKTGVVVVFEPDLGLLRAVLERLDCSAWLEESQVLIATDPSDAAHLGASFTGVAGLVTSGVQIVRHPPSAPRLGAQSERFADTLASVLKAFKLQVVTTLMQGEVTLRNVVQNLDHYVRRPGVADLEGAAAGRCAISVAAGPSLARNIDRLAEPGLRDRAVIIAAQTVLKPLLERGVRPHYVTAIDYHEISTRFYEGLSASDVEGVTLVAAPSANPAILEAFPGEVRLAREPWADRILGEGLARDMGELPPAATVAHLSYSLARRLGCDPVMLVGQDLGFSDGQYYAAGAAIHSVWAGELNGFNTLEMLEWQRIVRMRTMLSRRADVFGRSIYTDEQMHAYLQQFEELFVADAAAGRRTIDATEGGVAKRSTEPMTLDEALALHAPRGEPPLRLPSGAASHDDARIETARARLRTIADDCQRIAEGSHETETLLEEMLEHHKTQDRVNELIGRVERTRDRIVRLSPAYELAHHLNQVGSLKRVLADRKIELDDHIDAMSRQRRQIERDAMNVSWLAASAETAARVLREGDASLGAGEKITRAPVVASDDMDLNETAAETADALSGRASAHTKRVVALVPFEAGRSSLGVACEDASVPVLLGMNALQLTLRRIARSSRIDRVVVLADDASAARGVLEANDAAPTDGLDVEIRAWPVAPRADRRAAVRASRLLAPACWRGAPGNLSVYDELFEPSALVAALEIALEDGGADAACLIGSDWMMVDPSLIDACVDRYLERPDRHRVVFTQAAPGLAPIVVDRSIAAELSGANSGEGSGDRSGASSVFASVGGLTGYAPMAPQLDPIAKPVCVGVSPAARDLRVRATACTPDRRAALLETLAPLDAEALELTGEALADHLEGLRGRSSATPRELTLELGVGRLTSGRRGAWLRGAEEPIERPAMPATLAMRLAEAHGRARPDAVLHLGGMGDPLLHANWRDVVTRAHDAGVACVHVRTDLVPHDGDSDRLALGIIESGVDAVSIDLLADTPETYRALTGMDHFELAQRTLLRLLELRSKRTTGRADDAALLARPWIIPRITRCDETHEEIERFYDRWTVLAGACVIDPLPKGSESVVGEARIRPLPVPGWAADGMRSESMWIRSDGSSERVDAASLGLEAAWREVQRRRSSSTRSVAA
ncbi:MAG: 6-hydroxymethylpterin diphosphokinase MptE-like protein [Planctomycetota bacterium]